MVRPTTQQVVYVAGIMRRQGAVPTADQIRQLSLTRHWITEHADLYPDLG